TDFRIVDIDRTRRELFEALLDHPPALLELLDADEEAVHVVAFLADRNVEIQAVVDEVGLRPPDVVGDTRRAQQRTRDAERDQLLARELPGALHPLAEDRVREQQVLEVLLQLAGALELLADE